MNRENELIDRIKDEERIFIYGAGMVGRLVLKRLLYQGIRKEHIVFLTTNPIDNCWLDGCPIYTCSNHILDKGVVIVATKERFHEEIINNLSLNGCDIPIIICNSELCSDLENNHMRLYPVPDNGEIIDVLLMTSDNYKGSGAFLCAVELCEQMNQSGIKMMIILPEYGEGEDILIERKLPYAYIPSKNWCVDKNNNYTYNLFDNRYARQTIKEVIISHKVKIIHNNTSYTYVGAEAAIEAGITYVWHLRENISYQGQRFIDEKYTAKLMNGAGRIICVSQFESKAYEFLDCERISVVYDGIEENSFMPANNDRFSGSEVRIVNVGGINELKGQEDIIRAAAILKNSGMTFSVKLVGRGDELYINGLKLLVAENHMEKEVSFIGFSDNVKRIYDSSDIAIISSRADSFGRFTVEAMCSGCLMIGANAGATPEIIRNEINGYLYNVGDYHQLARVIINAYKNKKKVRELIDEGIRTGKQYTVTSNMKNIKEIYDVLSGKGEGCEV
ncbi:glycosyltransferase [Butyrivibrio sp. X503]|uniref:glycosyltransferase family 4 protein n=1 Tax=Butyrivibrio sp. X503 TaxID=2364878 RepID=UPI000EAAAD6D|nr:glycosyltransferase family 4 protein [Butyrivibrio sp. X503]RKM54437.1 glycosyltransferase [Butyrivibrio sp. X503]